MVLYDNRVGKAVVLNATGAWLWGQLDTHFTAEELAGRLQERFPKVDAAKVRNDVDACLRSLLDQDLLSEES